MHINRTSTEAFDHGSKTWRGTTGEASHSTMVDTSGVVPLTISIKTKQHGNTAMAVTRNVLGQFAPPRDRALVRLGMRCMSTYNIKITHLHSASAYDVTGVTDYGTDISGSNLTVDTPI